MIWLVTGGCGFVGSNLVDSRLAAGDDVVVLDNMYRVGASANLEWLRRQHGDAWRFAHVDVRDAGAVQQIVGETRPDVIAHLAGQVAMTTSIQDPRADFEINALGTLNVLEAVRLSSPETVVFYASSNKVYGSLDRLAVRELPTRYDLPDYPRGLDESLPLGPHSPYGCSKMAADHYVLDYHRIYGIRGSVFRFSSMYGGRQFGTFDQAWIAWFCSKAVERRHDPNALTFTISGSGKQVRDVLHARDVVELFNAAARNPDAGAGEAFNIGGGVDNAVSLLELFAMLESELGVTMTYTRLPPRAGDQLFFAADLTKATRAFGWVPSTSVQEGLREAVAWAQQNRATTPVSG